MRHKFSKIFAFIVSHLLFAFPSNSYGQLNKADVLKYINENKDLAIEQMALFKIPASVTLAQAILESNAGQSNLAVCANNHFGIKCHRGWQGDSILQDDEERNESFRKYEFKENSYLDRSLFLTSRSRYSFLFKLNMTDYYGWCLGLKKAGYATLPNYSAKLLFIIEVYNLAEFDRCAPMDRLTIANRLSLENEPDIKNNNNISVFLNSDKDLLAKALFNVITIDEPLLVSNKNNTFLKNSD